MDWTPEEGETLGNKPGRYEILEHIETGGFSEVFKSRDTRTGETVAVKTPNFDTRNLHLDKYVELEVKALRTLELLGGHQNAMTLREHFIERGADIIVVDYIDGETPEQLSSYFEPLDAIGVLADLLDVLAQFHRNDLVYRDVKADNLIISEGKPVLIDFNTVRPVNKCGACGTFIEPQHADKSACQDCGASLGRFTTVSDDNRGGFKAPEQSDPSKPTGPWVDVFALGKLLFFLVEGFTPPGTDVELDSEFPQYLSEIVSRATAADPTARYRDANHLKRALTSKEPSPGDPTAELIDETTNEVYEISPGDVLGRPTDQFEPDIAVAEPTPYLSRRHVVFKFHRHQWVLENRSRNGTFIQVADGWAPIGTDEARSLDTTSTPSRRFIRDGAVIAPVSPSVGRHFRFESKP